MKNPEHFTTTIPFSGFYESIHSVMIDASENQMFTNGDGTFYSELCDDFFDHVDYKEVNRSYAKAYVKSFSKEFNISLVYEDLVSPKFYNFETDRIFVKISRSDLAKMLWKVKGKILKEKARKIFTSRSGFISYYSNNIQDWGRISTWDHNQVGAVLSAYVDLVCDNWQDTEESLVCDYGSNGDIDEWLFCAADREGKLAISFSSILNEVYH